MKSLLFIITLAVSTISGFCSNFDVEIYWDGSIPSAHVYAWDGIPNTGTYFDLGEISVGVHTYTITNEPTYGGEFLVATPEAFALLGSLENGWSVGILQVWVWQDQAGINWYPDAGQYDTWDPEPFMCDYINGVIPDGFGGWIDGDPDTYATSLIPLSTTKKGHGKGHNKQ